MRTRLGSLLVILLAALPLFADGPAGAQRRRAIRLAPPAVRQTFDFATGANGWEGGFADYPPANEAEYELEWKVAPLPAEIGNGSAFFIRGDNHSDDLFMFLRRRLGTADGILPGRSYILTYRIVFASSAPSGCAGIGGSPGESVWLKAGAASVAPLPQLDASGDLRMNIDKGGQSEGGRDAGVVTTIGNGNPDCLNPGWRSLERTYRHPFPVTASNAGELWLIVGTDSGFEGTTALYYLEIEVRLWLVD